MFQAVTFDFWWTLYRNDSDAGSRWRLDQLSQLLQAAGHLRNPDQLAAAVRVVRLTNEQLQEEQGLDWSPEDQVAMFLQELGLPPGLGPQLMEVWTTPLLHHPPEPMPGVHQVLAELAGKYRLGIICNTGATPGWVLRRILESDGLLEYFQVLTFSNEHLIAKPNPEIFRRTLDGLGVNAGEAVHVGDNPRTDVGGAQQVGMRAIWFDSHPPHGPAPAADGIIRALIELPDRLARLG